MNENEVAFRLAKELAKKTLKKKISKEEALEALVRAGILDENGKFTASYPNLAKHAKYLNR